MPVTSPRLALTVVCATLVPALLTACAPKAVPPTQRPAFDAAKVQIMDKAPSEFEDHGPVLSEPIVNPPKDFDATKYVEQLKAAAAAKGANAILIAPADVWKEYGPRDGRYIYVGAFYKGQFYNFPVTTEATKQPKRLAAHAIYDLTKK